MAAPVITTEGLERIAARVETDASVYIAVGTDPTAPTSGDGALGAETYRQVATVLRDGQLVSFNTTILNANLPTTTQEVGVFLAGAAGAGTGFLLIRAAFPFTKGADDLILFFEITIQEG